MNRPSRSSFSSKWPIRRDESHLCTPTEFKGVIHRSRTEARWAVFFDSLGVTAHYEYQAFDLNGVPYVPDFYIPPQLKCPSEWWFEVKPDPAASLEKPLLWFESMRDKRIGILTDLPRRNSKWLDYMRYSILGDQDYAFCQCPRCGAFGFEFEGRCDRIGCSCCCGEENTVETENILRAFHTAKNAFKP
jgi:hypothetical protein